MVARVAPWSIHVVVDPSSIALESASTTCTEDDQVGALGCVEESGTGVCDDERVGCAVVRVELAHLGSELCLGGVDLSWEPLTHQLGSEPRGERRARRGW